MFSTFSSRQVLRRNPETCRQQLAIGRDIRDDRHAACNTTAVCNRIFEYDDRALADPLQLVGDRGHVEPAVHRLTDAEQFVGVVRRHHV